MPAHAIALAAAIRADLADAAGAELFSLNDFAALLVLDPWQLLAEPDTLICAVTPLTRIVTAAHRDAHETYYTTQILIADRLPPGSDATAPITDPGTDPLAQVLNLAEEIDHWLARRHYDLDGTAAQWMESEAHTQGHHTLATDWLRTQHTALAALRHTHLILAP